MSSTLSSGVDRRTLLKVGAWSAPVVALAVAVPRASASTTASCVFETVLTATPHPQNPTVLQAVSSSTGATYTVSISTSVAADSVVGQDLGSGYESYNMARSGSGIAGEGWPDGSHDYVFSGFGPTGAIVLNQRTATVAGDVSTPVAGAVDRQTLTFSFFDEHGTLIPTVRDVRIDMFDISSSVDQYGWRGHYWDAVGFSTAPTDITSSGPYPRGDGAGTFGDVYRRQNGNSPTVDVNIEDVFTFATFDSGTQMLYTQHGGRQGWHFMSISGIRFTLDECS